MYTINVYKLHDKTYKGLRVIDPEFQGNSQYDYSQHISYLVLIVYGRESN